VPDAVPHEPAPPGNEFDAFMKVLQKHNEENGQQVSVAKAREAFAKADQVPFQVGRIVN